MPIRAARLALTFLATLGLAGSALAAEDGHYPVWWSDELELGSLEQIDQRLRRDLWPDSPEGMELYVGGGPDGQQAQARDCDSLIKLSEAGYQGLGNPNIKVQLLNLAYCRAIALLGRAEPARKSHLRALRMNGEALDYLPAQVNLYASCEFVCYAVEANERGIPFTKFETPLVVDVRNGDEMVVWTTGSMVILSIVGRGDFTGDGVDDMLLLANGGATEGTYGASRLYLMTRDAPGAVLRVINAERELCPDYNCPGSSVFFYELLGSAPVPEDEGADNFVSERSDAGAAAAGPPYPVWWLQNMWFLWLQSLDEIDARRADKEEFRDGQGIPLYRRTEDDVIETRAYSCDGLEKLTREGHFGASDKYPWEQIDALASCRALVMLKRVKPAETSHLRTFALDAKAVDYLPATVLLPETCDLICRADEADRGGIPLSRFEKTLQVRSAYNDGIEIRTERRKVFLTIIARGDFTTDGMDDLLLMAQASLVDWPDGPDRLFLLTRDEPDAVLRIVTATPRLCPGYQCGRPDNGPEALYPSTTAPGPGDPPYPIWWSAGFDLNSLDQVDERLRRKIWPGRDRSIELYKGSHDDYVEAEARTCVELEALTQAGYGSTGGGLNYYQLRHLPRCRTIALLGTAQPARKSFLRDFVFGDENIRDMLMGFGLLRRSGTVPGADVQESQLVLARGLGRVLAVDVRGSDEVDVWADKGRVRIRIEARGDFTGDGVEDVLLFAGVSRSRHRPKLRYLCLITREAPGVALRVIEGGPYSCQELGVMGKPSDGDDPN